MIKLTENHEYKEGDMIIPGVTTVLQEVGIIQNSPWATTGRGKRMHKIIQYFLQGKLDFSDINQEEQELIEWISQVIINYKFQVVAIERTVYNQVYHYAGTIDYIFVSPEKRIFVADLKTGIKKEPWYKVQIAAYQQAIDNENVHGMILYQRTKGIEIITESELQQKYFPVFRSALNVYNFKEKK